jgi:hypothetical protein
MKEFSLFIKEKIELLKIQIDIEENDEKIIKNNNFNKLFSHYPRKNIIDISIDNTFYYLFFYHENLNIIDNNNNNKIISPNNFKKKFKISDKIEMINKLKVYSKKNEWGNFKKLYPEKGKYYYF